MAANTSVAVPTDRANGPAAVARFFVPEPAQKDTPERGLENTANNCVRVSRDSADVARFDRWEARGFLWKESSLDRVRGCGLFSIRPDGIVQVRDNGVSAGFAGLASCGSVHACPVCNSKIQATRRLELGVMIAAAASEGLIMAFGAKTLRHHAGQPLAALWPTMSQAFHSVSVDTSVRRLRKEMGFEGYARAAETTLGLNGWHPHLHPTYFFSNVPRTIQLLSDLQAVEHSAWSNKVQRLGLDAPLSVAQHLHLVTGDDAAKNLSDYFTKAGHQGGDSVAWDMASSQTKTGRRYAKTVTPWVLLAGARAGDADALDFWHEYEKASKGKRVLTYSRGLRRRFGLDVEATDEEIADAEIGTKDDALFEVTDWEPVRRNPRLGAGILAAARSGGLTGARRYCADNNIETREVL